MTRTHVKLVRNWLGREIVLFIVGTICVISLSVLSLGIFIMIGLINLSSAIGTSASLVQLLGPLIVFMNYTIRRRNQRKEAEEILTRELPVLQNQLKMDIIQDAKMFRVPPAWVDFRNHVYEREDLMELRDKVQSKPFSFLLAKSGAGKTTFAFHLGYNLLTECNWHFVFYWNVASSRGILDDLKQASRLLSNKYLKGEKALAIIDNAHLDEDLVIQLATRHGNIFGGQLVVLFIARTKSDSIEMDSKRWVRIFKEHGVENLVNFHTFKEDNVDSTIEGVLVTYAKANDFNLPNKKEDLRILKLELSRICRENLMLLKFVLEALKHDISDIQKVRQVTIAQAIREYYNKVITQVLQCERVHSVWHRMPQPIVRFQLVKRCLLLIAVFSTIELYTPRGFILKNIVSNVASNQTSREVATTFINETLSELNRRGELTTGLEIDNSDRFSFPHLMIAKTMSDVYPDEFSSTQLFFRIPNWNAEWPYEQGVFDLMLFAKEEGNEPIRNELSRVIESIDPFLDDENQIWALRGYLKMKIDWGFYDAPLLFKLANCCMNLNQPDDAKDAMAEALYMDYERTICDLDWITQSPSIRRTSHHAQQIARNLFDKFHPWIDTTTDISGSLLQYDVFDWIEVEGPCPFCGTDLYGESDIPIPNRSAESIHRSETVEGCMIECTKCKRLFDFSVFNNIAHSFFTLEPMPRSINQWRFRYRERCRNRSSYF